MATPEATSQVHIFDNGDEVARAATRRLIELARESIAARGRFSVALAGGSTPKVIYELLASDEFRDQVDWSRVHIFFGDERSVPPDHHESNYRMASEALLARVGLPPANIQRMGGEGDAVPHAR